MCVKQSRWWRATVVGWILFAVPCGMAQIQPIASPAVNREIRTAHPVVMDMRVARRQADQELSYNNNLLVTGNVGGGKHFRASVPYSLGSTIKASMPSDGLSSFFRLTQQQNLRSSSPMAYTPYYSTVATATYTTAEQSGIITPVTFSQLPNMSVPTHQKTQNPVGLTSMGMQMDETILHQPKRRSGEKARTTSMPDNPLLMPASPDLERLFRMPENMMNMDMVLPMDVNVSLTQSSDPSQHSMDVNNLGRRLPEETPEGHVQDPNMVASAYTFTSKMALQAYAQTKFNTFMKAGEMYLKQGLYDKADDAYSLACVYKSGHALAVAGKSHALLAKRAYSSSALFLIRALNDLPAYAQTDMGLPDLVGGFDVVKAHIDRLEAYTEGKHVPELKLLLAFIYLQMDDVGLAQEALKNVYPDSSYEVARLALMEAASM
jgi:hypothetical protein